MKKKSSVKIRGVMIQIIDHAQQRYDTVGDWFFEEDILHIRVSELPNDPSSSMALAIAFHEFCEIILCNEKGISQKDVDKFDMSWEPFFNGDISEPGDSPSALYHLEHSFATSCERMLIAALGIPWANYERCINSLGRSENGSISNKTLDRS